MEREAFLISSYFAAGLLCAAVGWSAWLWLRASIEAIAKALPPHPLKAFIGRAFPSSAILLALSGFASVNYLGCGAKETYAQVLADRAWMIERNQRQIAEALTHTAWIVCLWVLIVSIAVIALRRRGADANLSSRAEPAGDR